MGGCIDAVKLILAPAATSSVLNVRSDANIDIVMPTLNFNFNWSFLKDRNVCMTIVQWDWKEILLVFASVSMHPCSMCVSGKWSRWMAAEGLGCPLSSSSWWAKPGRGHPRGPCRLITYSRAPLHTRLVIVIRYRFHIHGNSSSAAWQWSSFNYQEQRPRSSDDG